MKKYIVIFTFIFIGIANAFAQTATPSDSTLNFDVKRLSEAFEKNKTGGQKILQYYVESTFLGIRTKRVPIYANLILLPESCTYCLVHGQDENYLDGNIIMITEHDLNGSVIKMYGVKMDGNVLGYNFATLEKEPSAEIVIKVENILKQVEVFN